MAALYMDESYLPVENYESLSSVIEIGSCPR